MRTSEPDLPVAPAAICRRSSSTTFFTPSLARWNAVLVPLAPPPTTMTSAIVTRHHRSRGRASHHLACTEIGDRARAVAELRQDLVRVLAQHRRPVAERARRLGEIDRRRRKRRGPLQSGVLAIDEQAGRAD